LFEVGFYHRILLSKKIFTHEDGTKETLFEYNTQIATLQDSFNPTYNASSVVMVELSFIALQVERVTERLVYTPPQFVANLASMANYFAVAIFIVGTLCYCMLSRLCFRTNTRFDDKDEDKGWRLQFIPRTFDNPDREDRACPPFRIFPDVCVTATGSSLLFCLDVCCFYLCCCCCESESCCYSDQVDNDFEMGDPVEASGSRSD
jgi:hypothetical protein